MDIIEEKITSLRAFQAECTVPGDKSIAHRVLFLGALAHGVTKVINLPQGKDVLATIDCLKQLGVIIYPVDGTSFLIHGKGGLSSFRAKHIELDAQNSGTTARLLLGLLAGSSLTISLVGDASLSRRPMVDVVRLLQFLGAFITGHTDDFYLPLTIKGRQLQGRHLLIDVASAQTKSSLLLAGLYAKGKTSIVEPLPTRDHTERLFPLFGVSYIKDGSCFTIHGGQKLRSVQVTLPGDFSSAAFLLAAAIVTPGSRLCIHDVCLNHLRTGFVGVLQQMGVDIKVTVMGMTSGEPFGRIIVKAPNKPLKCVEITSCMVPSLIDELPLLAILATTADGLTVLSGAQTLRYKEADRIKRTVENINILGGNAKETPDGWIIKGPSRLSGVVSSFGDHRIAMAFMIAGLASHTGVTVKDSSVVDVSFPQFLQQLYRWQT